MHILEYANDDNLCDIRKVVIRIYADYDCHMRAFSDPVYTIQPVVKPLEQPVVSCIQTFNRLNNRLNVCLHDATGCSTALTTGCIV